MTDDEFEHWGRIGTMIMFAFLLGWHLAARWL